MSARFLHHREPLRPVRPRLWRKRIVFGMALTGILAGVIWLFTTPRLAVAEIYIEGLETIDREGVKSFARQQLSGPWNSRRFAVSPEKIAAKLETEFLFTQTLVRLEGPDLFISVVERPSVLEVDLATGRFFIDDHGKIINKIEDQTSVGKMVVEIDQIDFETEPKVGDQIISPAAVKGIVDFKIGAEKLSLVLDRFLIENAEHPWCTVVINGLKVYFDPERDIAEQLAKYQLYLKQGMANSPALEYIDLRFNNRIYTK